MKKTILIIFVYLIAPVLYAASNSGSDSCGIGWEVTKRKSLLSTSVRGTTNAILPPTFSMTSGTSGCDHHAIVENEREALQFAAVNLDSLKSEIAEGQGEYMISFAQTLHCDTKGREELSGVLRQNLSQISVDEPFSFFSKVKHQIKTSPELKDHCLVG